MQKRSDLEPIIRQEWMKRSSERRTENDVLSFCGELQQNRPDLLSFRASGDKYQVLKSILKGHIES